MLASIILFAVCGLATFLLSRSPIVAAVAACAGFLLPTPYMLYIIPRRLCSALVGKLMKVRLGCLATPVLKLYIRLTGVDMATVQKPLSSFRSV